MKLFRILRSLVLPSLVLSFTACDPGGNEGSESSDQDEWSRVLYVDSFESTVVYRHSYGGCSYVRTYETIGDGEGCSEGALHVGLADSDGDLVAGGFALCGSTTITTDHDDACHGMDETTTQPLEDVGFIELSATDADAPMTMRWRWADGLVLEAEIEAASAFGDGEQVSVRFVDGDEASDGAQREVSVDAELVLVSVSEETGGCGVAPGRPSGATFRCG
jgi:hypothetical protein